MNIFLNGAEYILNLAVPINEDDNDILLLSSGKYILQDSNGVRLITSPLLYTESEEALITSQDDILIKDSNGLFLNHKESE